MTILDLHSKRMKRVRGEVPEVFVYDQIPLGLRAQISHIWRDAFGQDSEYSMRVYELHEQIEKALAREYGLLKLGKGDSPGEVLFNFLMTKQDVDQVLDLIQLSFFAIEHLASDPDYRLRTQPRIGAEEAVGELNARFREHGVGYQYADCKIIRMDSEFLHREVVVPALALLRDPQYAGANEEFLKAHEHYRKDDAKDCLIYCLKAFESTMKAICDKRGWSYNATDTARVLIDVCIQNGLVPVELRSNLESGIPTLRNRLGGHGQGSGIVQVPLHLAAYSLNMTGSAIQMLVEAEKTLT